MQVGRLPPTRGSAAQLPSSILPLNPASDVTFSAIFSAAVGNSQRSRLVALALILSAACSAPPSPVDKERLAALQQQYGHKFDFAFDSDLYVRAVSRDTAAPSLAEMQNVYRTFMFEENGTRRRSTTFVYINVYDAHGDFRYQVAFDPKASEFVLNKTEHY